MVEEWEKHDNGTLEFRNYGINGIEEFMDLRGEGLNAMLYALCSLRFRCGLFGWRILRGRRSSLDSISP